MRLLLPALLLCLSACAPRATTPPATSAAAPPPAARSPGPAAARALPALPGLLLVANKAEARLDILDGRTGTTLATLATGTGPHEVAASADGKLAVVCNYGESVPGDSLTVVDLAARAVARTVTLGEHRRPHGVAFVPGQARTAAITSETSQALLLVDVQAGAVTATIPTRQRGSHMVTVRADGARAYTANIEDGSISELDLVARTHLRFAPVAAKAEAIALAPDGTTLWVGSNEANTITVLDTGSLQPRAVLPAGDVPIRVVISRDGRFAVVTQAVSGELRIFDASQPGQRAAVTLPLSMPDPPPGPGQSPVPIGVALVDAPAVALVSEARSGEVAVVDLERAELLGHFPLRPGIDGIAWVPDAS